MSRARHLVVLALVLGFVYAGARWPLHTLAVAGMLIGALGLLCIAYLAGVQAEQERRRIEEAQAPHSFNTGQWSQGSRTIPVTHVEDATSGKAH